MDVQHAYCSACDQEVRIVVTEAPVHGGQAVLAGPEVVCLDFGARCTGSMCPMFGLPSIMMGVRLAKSDLRPDAFRTVPGPCPECGETVELKVLNKDFVYCPACGGRSRWLHIELDEEQFVALGKEEPRPAPREP
jgi:hypothetical protein